MANATSIAITDLTANGQISAPATQTLDTGTAAVTLETPDLAGTAHRCWLEVWNTHATATLTVSVAAGDNPPAFRAGVGAFTGAAIAAVSGHALICLGDSSRFLEGGGKLKVTFTPSTGTITGAFTLYRLPRAG